MSSELTIDVVVVCFNSDAELLEACIASVERSYESCGVSGEIILVDNRSDPPVSDSIDTSGVRVLTMDCNVGFGRAVNHGVRGSAAEYVLMLNPDAAIGSDGLSCFLEGVQREPRSIVGGWLQRDGVVQSDAYMQWDFSLERLWRRKKFSSSLIESEGDLLCVEKVCGGALFASRALLLEFGPFDPRFFLYGEDADLSRRAKKAGVSLLLARRAYVEHIAASSQKNFGVLVEEARADASVRITSYHRSRIISLVQRAELAIVTLAGAVVGGRSSSTRRARLARLGQIRRWGAKADIVSYRP